jgi:hypothetical protein
MYDDSIEKGLNLRDKHAVRRRGASLGLTVFD